MINILECKSHNSIRSSIHHITAQGLYVQLVRSNIPRFYCTLANLLGFVRDKNATAATANDSLQYRVKI